MKSFFYLGITATLATLAIAESTFHRSLLQSKQKREFLTCEETYHGGSITCGPAGSHYCYDPMLGEACVPSLSSEDYVIDSLIRVAACLMMVTAGRAISAHQLQAIVAMT
jgi:hypothetical protein